MISISDYLMNVSYPGRAIVMGMSEDSLNIVSIYLITGRSENSRNRVLEAENKAIKIRIYDETNLSDSSLIKYYPVRVCGNILIVTNGDQTDSIYQYIREGHSFEDALRTRTFEPDSLLTPRISSIINIVDGSYRLSILKSDGEYCNRFFYEYEPVPGKGRYISTYTGDPKSPNSFMGEPAAVSIDNDIDVMTDMVWNALSKEYRVSIYVRYINTKTKEYNTRIVNRLS